MPVNSRLKGKSVRKKSKQVLGLVFAFKMSKGGMYEN